jgi:hypothetical protein
MGALSSSRNGGEPSYPVAQDAQIRFWFTRNTKKSKAAGGEILRLSVRNLRKSAIGPSSAAKDSPSRLSLLDGPFPLRRRQGLVGETLIVVKAAAQHQGGGEDGKGQNRAHERNPPKRDFRLFTPPPLRK